MKSIILFDRRVGFLVAAVALMLATIVPAIVSAAQLTERSVALSSSSAKATNVSYTINFKSVSAAGAFVVDFCSNSPLIGQACTAPTGFSASAVTSTDTVSALSANTVRVTNAIGAGASVTVQLDKIDNPTDAGKLYARIITYDTATNANLYSSTALGTGSVDDGGAAMSITPTIGVSAAVLETLSFCVSGEAISANCAVGAKAPTLKLGQGAGDVVALDSTQVSEGAVFTQISTNAVSGAVVSLKSSAFDCGGLLRAGAGTAASRCGIEPALLAGNGITAGQARFGVKVSAASSSAGVPDATGAFVPVTGSGYSLTDFLMNFTIGNASGVTSPFGDLFLDTAGAPVNNKNVQLTFGASASNNTPAGLYSADLSLIATGKF